jgi:peptidyl-prolyl cis-trans isomerase C
MTAGRKAILRTALIAAMAVTPLMLAACGGAGDPSGQVVATVEGKEITKRDLVAEFQSNNVQPSEDPAARSAMLEQIIRRKLLANEAVEQKLDKTPEYLAAVERTRDMVLAGLLSKRRVAMAPTPSDDAARKFVAANPQMFGERRLLLINQVQAPAAGIDPRSLEKYTDIGQITALFQQQKRKFNTRQTVLDTANLPGAMASRIVALAPGDVFIVNQGNAIIANAIVKSEAQPVPEARRMEVAKQMLQRIDEEKVIKQEIDTRRKTATIDYQPGYAPPKANAAKGK